MHMVPAHMNPVPRSRFSLHPQNDSTASASSCSSAVSQSGLLGLDGSIGGDAFLRHLVEESTSQAGPRSPSIAGRSDAMSFNGEASTSSQQGEIPSSVFYNYPSCGGPTPPGRWAHSCTCIGSHMVVYGGIATTMLDDLWMLDTNTMHWRHVKPAASTAKDRPDKTLAHAAAALEKRMWMFGGQQGRTFIRKLYVFDLDQMSWRRVPTSDNLPSARAGHAMTALHADSNTIFLFGGQGKKFTNDLWKLDTRTARFTEVQAAGKLPLPRRGMSLVFDGRDSLICFGGTHSSGIDSALHVFNTQRNEWYQPSQVGDVPSPRTNHSAVLLAPNQMLLFGGCNAQGTFFNDAYILNLATYTWHKLASLNMGPAPRYHHSCCRVKDGQALIYGGISAKQAFDGVVVLDTKFAPDISHIAEELQTMVSSTSGQLTPTESRHSTSSQRSQRELDLMRVQLTDLLYKRNMEELHTQASTKAETTEALLAKEREVREGERREKAQLAVLLSEAQAEVFAARRAAREAETRAARDAAVVAELRAAVDAAQARLAEREAEAEAARRLNHGLVKELGVLASRCAKLQAQGKASGGKKQGPSSGALSETADKAAGRSTSGSSTPQREEPSASTPPRSQEIVEGSFSIEPSSSSGFMSDRLSQQSAVSGGVDLVDDVVSLLVEAQQQKEAMQGELGFAKAQLEAMVAEKAGLQNQLDQLKGDPTALSKLSVAALQELEQQLDRALRSTREAVLQRRIAEVERRAVNEQHCCSLCLERPRCIVFNCGHQSCKQCSETLPECPFCRTTITAKIKMFDS